MKAGRLTETVALYERKVARNAYNEEQERYVYARDVRCDVSVKDTRQMLRNNAESLSGALVVYVRYYQEMAIADRIVYGDEVYEIVSVVPDKVNMMKIITAEWRFNKNKEYEKTK